MQLAAYLRVSEPVELFARSLSGARCGRNREHRADQAPLLWKPAAREPDRYCSGRTTARLRGAPRPRTLRHVALTRSEEHTSELQSLRHLVCRLLLEKKKNTE